MELEHEKGEEGPETSEVCKPPGKPQASSLVDIQVLETLRWGRSEEISSSELKNSTIWPLENSMIGSGRRTLKFQVTAYPPSGSHMEESKDSSVHDPTPLAEWSMDRTLA